MIKVPDCGDCSHSSNCVRATEDEAPVYRHLAPDVVCVKPKDGEEKCYDLQQDRNSQYNKRDHFELNFDHSVCDHFYEGPGGRLMLYCNGDPLLMATKGKTRARCFRVAPKCVPSTPLPHESLPKATPEGHHSQGCAYDCE